MLNQFTKDIIFPLVVGLILEYFLIVIAAKFQRKNINIMNKIKGS